MRFPWPLRCVVIRIRTTIQRRERNKTGQAIFVKELLSGIARIPTFSWEEKFKFVSIFFFLITNKLKAIRTKSDCWNHAAGWIESSGLRPFAIAFLEKFFLLLATFFLFLFWVARKMADTKKSNADLHPSIHRRRRRRRQYHLLRCQHKKKNKLFKLFLAD